MILDAKLQTRHSTKSSAGESHVMRNSSRKKTPWELASTCTATGDRVANLAQPQRWCTLAYDVISDVTLSESNAFDAGEVRDAVDAYIDQIPQPALVDVVGMPNWVPRPSRLFKKTARKRMHKVADHAIMACRSARSKDVPDLLCVLLSSTDPETDRKRTNIEIRNNLLTFIAGKLETRALTTS